MEVSVQEDLDNINITNNSNSIKNGKKSLTVESNSNIKILPTKDLSSATTLSPYSHLNTLNINRYELNVDLDDIIHAININDKLENTTKLVYSGSILLNVSKPVFAFSGNDFSNPLVSGGIGVVGQYQLPFYMALESQISYSNELPSLGDTTLSSYTVNKLDYMINILYQQTMYSDNTVLIMPFAGIGFGGSTFFLDRYNPIIDNIEPINADAITSFLMSSKIGLRVTTSIFIFSIGGQYMYSRPDINGSLRNFDSFVFFFEAGTWFSK